MQLSPVPAQIVDRDRFTREPLYRPPPAAYGARSLLVKPNLGYPPGPGVTVSLPVLAAVLRALRQASPHAHIYLVEGVCSPLPLAEIVARCGLETVLDEGMTWCDAETLPWVEYPNRHPQPVRFGSLWAPALLSQVDCCLSVGTFKRTQLNGQPLISASLKNLYGLLPRAHYRARSPHARGQLHRPSVGEILADVYGCLGSFFAGAVVDGTWRYCSPDWRPDRRRNVAIAWGKVAFGSGLLAVDRAVCEAAGEPLPEYLRAIAALAAPPSETLAHRFKAVGPRLELAKEDVHDRSLPGFDPG